MFKGSQEICRGLEIENKEIRERNVMYLNKLKSFSQELLAERAKVAELQKEKIIKSKKVSYQLRITEELWSEVQKKSNQLGIAANAYMVMAINNYANSK